VGELFTCFLISFPIDGITLFIQTDVQNAHVNKRRELLHKPIIFNHSAMEALPPLTWLSPIHSLLLPQNPLYALGALLILYELKGGITPAVNLPAGVTVGQCCFRKNEWLVHILLSHFVIFALFYFCNMDYFLILIFWGGTAFSYYFGICKNA